MKKSLLLPKRIRFVIMVSFLHISTLFLLCSMVVANPTIGQDLLEKKLSLSVTNSTVKNTLVEIEKNAKVKFSYNSRMEELTKVITIDVKEEPLHFILDKLLIPFDINYLLINNKIILQKKKIITNSNFKLNEINTNNKLNEIQLTTTSDIKISGKVTDERGDVLAGVTVSLKGTSLGTTTNASGNFTLDVPNPNSILVFNFIGYDEQEYKVANNISVQIKLKLANNLLNEVVVTGYNSVKKRDLTGAISKIDAKDIALSSSNNLTKSLQGAAPGLVVRQGSPQPGFDNNPIYIRGTGTFNNSEALVVIDGVPDRVGGLSRLTPDEIESISVIKDATASIYGARSANGVLVVTTKKGKLGKPNISYANAFSYDKPIFLPPTLDKLDFVTWQKEAADYLGGTTYKPYTAEGIQAYKNGTADGYVFPNGLTPVDILFDKNYWAPREKHNISIQGGSESTKYFASFGISNQLPTIKSDISKFRQQNLRLNIDQRISKYIDLSISLLARKESNRLWPGGDPQFLSVPENTPSMMGRMFMNLYLSGPLSQAYWPNGLKTSGGALIEQIQGKGGQVNTSDLFIQSNVEANLKIPGINGLSIKTSVAYDNYSSYMKKLTKPIDVYYLASGATNENGLVKGTLGTNIALTQYFKTTVNALYQSVLNYEKKFNDHSIGLLSGISREEANSQNFWTHRANLISDLTDVLSQGSLGTERNSGGEFASARLNYFGNFNYNYKKKYFLQFLYRYDGSYLFPESNRFGFFPGVSAGWVISDEKFMDKSPFSFLKLRGSYGELGNDNIPPNQFLSSYRSGVWFVNNATVQTLNEFTVANPFITWEVAKNIDFGIEGSILRNRINFEIDYFNSKRNNILTKPYGSIADITGIVPPFENIGKTLNKGWEFTLGYKAKIGQLNINTTGFLSTNNNTLIFADEPAGLDPAISREGRRIGAWKYWNILGVFQNQKEVTDNQVNYTAVGNGTLKPGDLIIEDVNGDGKINSYDYRFTSGSVIPKMTTSLGFQLGYKNLDATLRFYGTFGGYLDQPYGYNNGYISKYVFDNRWTKEGDISPFGRANNRNGGNPYVGNMIAKTDHIKLQYLELGYNIDSKSLNRIFPAGIIESIRIYLNANDLFYWKFDPKLWSHPEAFVGDVDGGSGIFIPLNPAQTILSNTNLTYANKSLTFGVNVKF